MPRTAILVGILTLCYSQACQRDASPAADPVEEQQTNGEERKVAKDTIFQESVERVRAFAAKHRANMTWRRELAARTPLFTSDWQEVLLTKQQPMVFVGIVSDIEKTHDGYSIRFFDTTELAYWPLLNLDCDSAIVNTIKASCSKDGCPDVALVAEIRAVDSAYYVLLGGEGHGSPSEFAIMDFFGGYGLGSLPEVIITGRCLDVITRVATCTSWEDQCWSEMAP